MANEVQVLLASELTAAQPALAGAPRPRARRDRRQTFAAARRRCQRCVEAGLPRLDVQTWIGFVAPTGTPPPIVDKLNQALNRILRSADMQAWLQKQGLDPIGGSPAVFGAEIRADFDKWGKVTRGLGIRPQ